MPFVTLTTDWGLRDQHVAVLKGMLYKRIEDLTIVDISHDIQPFNIAQAAYIFCNAYPHFPEGTIHYVGVSTFPSTSLEIIALKKEGYSFIGMNDGFFSLVFEEQPVDMVAIENSDTPFTAFDITAIVNTIVKLASGKNIYELGSRPSVFDIRGGFRPVIEEDVIRGTVIYIDEFGNAITNIDKKLFETHRGERKFEINARRQQYTMSELHPGYASVERGSLVALFNNAGYLEIAINQGNASALLGLKNNDTIRIDFL